MVSKGGGGSLSLMGNGPQLVRAAGKLLQPGGRGKARLPALPRGIRHSRRACRFQAAYRPRDYESHTFRKHRDSGQTKMSAGHLTWQRPSWELLWTKAGHRHLTLLQMVHVFLNLLIPVPLRRLGAGGEATCPRPARGDLYGGLCSQPECGSCLHPSSRPPPPASRGGCPRRSVLGLFYWVRVCVHTCVHTCVR